MKTFQDFLYIMDFIGNQTVQGPNESFSAASKGFKRHQTMNISQCYCFYCIFDQINATFVSIKNFVQTSNF